MTVLIRLFNNYTLSACLSHYNTHTQSAFCWKHDSIVYLNETFTSFCATKMVFLISCRNWMTALSDTVTPTLRLFWVILTARCHQARRVLQQQEKKKHLRATGADWRTRLETRHIIKKEHTYCRWNFLSGLFALKKLQMWSLSLQWEHELLIIMFTENISRSDNTQQAFHHLECCWGAEKMGKFAPQGSIVGFLYIQCAVFHQAGGVC